MLAENCCYKDDVMRISRIVQSGLFGSMTFAECGYVHAVPSLLFDQGAALHGAGK